MKLSIKDFILNQINAVFQQVLDYKMKEIGSGENWINEILMPKINMVINSGAETAEKDKYAVFVKNHGNNPKLTEMDVTFISSILLYSSDFGIRLTASEKEILHALRNDRNEYSHNVVAAAEETNKLNAQALKDIRSALACFAMIDFGEAFRNNIASAEKAFNSGDLVVTLESDEEFVAVTMQDIYEMLDPDNEKYDPEKAGTYIYYEICDSKWAYDADADLTEEIELMKKLIAEDNKGAIDSMLKLNDCTGKQCLSDDELMALANKAVELGVAFGYNYLGQAVQSDPSFPTHVDRIKKSVEYFRKGRELGSYTCTWKEAWLLPYLGNAKGAYDIAVNELADDEKGTEILYKTGRNIYYREHELQQYDESLMFKCFEQAYVRGSKEAAIYLATCYRYGYGTNPSPEYAVKVLKKAAEDNDSEACRMLAYYYLEGTGVKRDNDMFWQYINKGIRLGNAQCCKIKCDVSPDFELYKRAIAGGIDSYKSPHWDRSQPVLKEFLLYLVSKGITFSHGEVQCQYDPYFYSDEEEFFAQLVRTIKSYDDLYELSSTMKSHFGKWRVFLEVWKKHVQLTKEGLDALVFDADIADAYVIPDLNEEEVTFFEVLVWVMLGCSYYNSGNPDKGKEYFDFVIKTVKKIPIKFNYYWNIPSGSSTYDFLYTYMLDRMEGELPPIKTILGQKPNPAHKLKYEKYKDINYSEGDMTQEGKINYTLHTLINK